WRPYSRSRQDQVAVTIDPPAPWGRDEGGGVELLDDGRTFDRRADVETRALVEHRLHRRSVERDRALALDRGGGRPRRRRRRRRARLVFGYGHTHAQAIAHPLHRPFLGGVAMDLGVAPIQPVARRAQRRRRQPTLEQSRERRAQFVALAGVTQVELTREAGVGGVHTFGDQFRARRAFQLPEDVFGVVGGDVGEGAQLGADVIVHHVG